MSLDLPDITVVILTYEREAELKLTLAALREHLQYPAAKLDILIADDASPGGVARYKRLADFKGVKWLVNEANLGWGATVNRALRAATTDLVFFLEDDYVLKRDLDLRIGAALLTVAPHLGLLRYYGVAGEQMVLHVFEAEIGALLPDFRDGMSWPGHLTYLQLDGGSPSPYLYSNRPHLRARAFTAFYGEYDEGRKLGATEEAYAVRVKTRMREQPDRAPGIVVLPENIVPVFDHIGQSYQLGDEDKGL